MTEKESDNRVGGVDVGSLESASMLENLGGWKRWREGEDIVFGDL